MPSPIHLKPATELAERVLLPGDPHRALAVAQALLEEPLMFNHHRGLWGYTGRAPDGMPLSIQATGMGGPSAAIVVEELLDLGARTLVRIGTCGAIADDLRLGELIVATAALAEDGTSAALGARGAVSGDERLTAALAAAARQRGGARVGPVASTDLFYDQREGMAARWRREGALAVEMEAATVLQVARRRGAAAACLLSVTDLILEEKGARGRSRVDQAGMEQAGIRLGDVAVDALAALAAGEPFPAGRP